MTNEAWAAWVQAVGSIAAVVAAFLFPWRENHATKVVQREERAARKQLLLRGVVSALKDVDAKLEGQVARLRRVVEGMRLHGSAGHVQVDAFDFGPQQLESLVDGAYLLGAAAAGEFADVAEDLEEFRRGLQRGQIIEDIAWADARLLELDKLRSRVAALWRLLEREIVRVPASPS